MKKKKAFVTSNGANEQPLGSDIPFCLVDAPQQVGRGKNAKTAVNVSLVHVIQEAAAADGAEIKVRRPARCVSRSLFP